MAVAPDPVGCTDACGAKLTPDPTIPGWTPAHHGWFRLPITGRWRCPACANTLMRINARKELE